MYFLLRSSHNKETNFFAMLNLTNKMLLFKRCENQVIRCVPQGEYDEIITKCHYSPYEGHFGGERTTQKV